MHDSPYLRTPAAADRVGLSVATLERLRVEGGGPEYLQPSPKRILYKISDLDTWVERHRRASTSQRLEPAEAR